ncbi:MAG: hypothetical protein AAF360_01015, partial [Pseudomonadota bacterium]
PQTESETDNPLVLDSRIQDVHPGEKIDLIVKTVRNPYVWGDLRIPFGCMALRFGWKGLTDRV